MAFDGAGDSGRNGLPVPRRAGCIPQAGDARRDKGGTEHARKETLFIARPEISVWL